MPFASKENGYPVEDNKVAAAVIEEAEAAAPKVLKTATAVQLTLKDRSIINQTAWKCAAMVSAALGNYHGSQEALVVALQELKAKVEADMLSVYKS